jgi:NADH-quinone oxidoreductase subunit C
VIRYLKEDENLKFTFLTDLCGIHYPDRGLPLGVIYHLHNLRENFRLRVKTFLTLKDPVVPTVTDLFASANWMERETYDFYGILFEGHPNLKRILNVEYLDFFPMRKEYPLEDPTREDKDDRYFGR